MRNVSHNNQYMPDLILTNRATYNDIEEMAWGKAQIQMGVNQIEFMYDAFLFDGAVVLWDNTVTAPSSKQNRIYVLNTECLELVTHTERWMTPEPRTTLPSTDNWYQSIFSTFQLTCDNRRVQGVWDQAT